MHFHIPVLRGRTFTDRDDASAPGVIIINQTMARMFWPNGDPLNDRLLVGRGMRPEYEQDPIRQIVGIVGDVRDARLMLPQASDVCSRGATARRNQRTQSPPSADRLDCPHRVEPHSLRSAIEEQLRKGTGQPVARVRSMDEVTAQSTARGQLNTLLMTIFGCSALLLAAIGIYG